MPLNTIKEQKKPNFQNEQLNQLIEVYREMNGPNKSQQFIKQYTSFFGFNLVRQAIKEVDGD